MKRVAVIGTGLIGAPVARAIDSGAVGDWLLCAVLNRSGGTVGETPCLTDAEQFLDSKPDLIIEAASVEALQQYGEQALVQADVWTINAAGLADPTLVSRLEKCGREHGHRLRVVSGAIAGLDGVGALAVDQDAKIKVSVDLMPSAEGRSVKFSGTAREAALAFPEHVNVGAATALAGSGLEKTQVEVAQPALGESRAIGLVAHSRYGKLAVQCEPQVIPKENIHLVAASIIAALKQEQQTIWVG